MYLQQQQSPKFQLNIALLCRDRELKLLYYYIIISS